MYPLLGRVPSRRRRQHARLRPGGAPGVPGLPVAPLPPAVPVVLAVLLGLLALCCGPSAAALTEAAPRGGNPATAAAPTEAAATTSTGRIGPHPDAARTLCTAGDSGRPHDGCGPGHQAVPQGSRTDDWDAVPVPQPVRAVRQSAPAPRTAPADRHRARAPDLHELQVMRT